MSVSPFFMSFSFLKTFPVSAMMKASPFPQRLRTETPGLAASMTTLNASKKKRTRPMFMDKKSPLSIVYRVLMLGSQRRQFQTKQLSVGQHGECAPPTWTPCKICMGKYFELPDHVDCYWNYWTLPGKICNVTAPSKCYSENWKE